MMRKIWWIAVPLVLAGAAMMVMARGSGPQWTTTSEQALAEFERGLAAHMKYYRRDALGHFRRALELDPGFAAAKVRLIDLLWFGEERDRLLAELREADLQRLNDRERFLVGYTLAVAERRTDDARRLLEEYLERHPGDPYALFNCSTQAFDDQDWEKAERHFRRLLEADPNWVTAHNLLGYLALAQGKFQEAEEHFETYKFIAPDQANPYDSLSEMLMVVGRYDEARSQLEQALAIKPDFCASYFNLLNLAVLEGRPENLDAVVDRAAPNCGKEIEKLRCWARLWKAFLALDFDAPWRDEMVHCHQILEEPPFLVHRMAVLSGRTAEALAIEEELLRMADDDTASPLYAGFLKAFEMHLEGSRLAMLGQYEEAIERMRGADDAIYYWGMGGGVLKLYNRLNLAWALEHAGDKAASQRVLAQVEATNPRFAAIYEKLEMTPRRRPDAADRPAEPTG